MADPNIQKIKFLRSTTSGSRPSVDSLEEGELALNLADKVIFSKLGNNIVDLGLGKGGSISGDLDISGKLTVGSSLNVGNGITGSLIGNSSTATKLATARSIAISGSSSGSATFDGSNNINISTVVNNALIGNDWSTNFRGTLGENTSKSVFLDVVRSESTTNGLGRYGTGIAFGKDDTHGMLYLNYNNGGAILAAGNANRILWTKSIAFLDSDITGNSATTNKLQLGRYIKTSGGATSSVLFDGSGDVTLGLGTNWSGNSDTATKLQIGRYINGTLFDGTGDISIDPVNQNKPNLDSMASPGFWINGTSASDLPLSGGDYAGLTIGYNYDCSQIYAANGWLWVRGSDANPIGTGDWGPWRKISYIDSDSTGNAATATQLKTPRYIKTSGGATASVSFNGTGDVTLGLGTNWAGNASTASSLQTSRKIELTNAATGNVYFDGSSDVAMNVTKLDATKLSGVANISGIKSTAASFYFDSPNNSTTAGMRVFLSDAYFNVWNFSSSKNILQLGNDNSAILNATTTVNGILTVTGSIRSNSFIDIGYGVDGTANRAISFYNNKSIQNQIKLTSNNVLQFTGSTSFDNTIVGNIDSADKLAVARKITISGNGISGSGTFDGSGDLTISPTFTTQATATNNTTVATTAFVQAVNSADTGSSATAVRLKLGRYIKTSGGATSSVLFDGTGDVTLGLGTNWAGNANTATKFAIGRNIKVTGGATTLAYIDGTRDVDMNLGTVWTGTATNSIGEGQKWQDVSSSRAIKTTYTNDTGRPIMVSVAKTNQTREMYLVVDGVNVAYATGANSNGQYKTLCAIVPTGSTYATAGDSEFNFWTELR